MPYAYEALTKRLQKLDRWISETERVAAVATDIETRQQIANDLTRWRESRRECSALLARIKWLNRAVFMTMTLLIVSFAAIFVFAFFGTPQSGIVSVLLVIDYLILFSSTLALVPVIALRDSVARGGEPWRFSLRSVLILMTAVALTLGAIVWAARH